MRRTAILLAVIALLGYLHLITHNYRHKFNLKSQSIRLQHAILKKWLQRDHIYLPATHGSVEFSGRWTTQVDRLGKETGFPGSSAGFVLKNSTSLFIDLTEASSTSRDHPLRKRLLENVLPTSDQDVVQSGSVPSVLVTLRDVRYLFEGNAKGILCVSQNLTVGETYRITIRLLGSLSEYYSPLQFRGIWLGKGGSLVESVTREINRPSYSHAIHDSTMSTEGVYDDTRSQIAKIIEIVAPSSTLGLDAEASLPDHSSRHDLTYPKLLEASKDFNAQIIPLPIPSTMCLTQKCHNTHNHGPHRPTIQELYFRTGPTNSPLFHRPWSWSSSSTPPTTLIFDIGFTDFHTFLSTLHDQPANHQTRHLLETFKTHFVTSLVNLILTIRRTTWHQQRPDEDPTYSYTSAPSDLTILLLTPIIPPIYPSLLTTLTHTALHETTTRLHRIEGDKRTFLIDTSGWLSTSDFELPPPPPSNTSTHAVSPIPPVPNCRGHRIIAHHLSVHLCPHLSTDPTTCAFDRPDIYLGNLYTPVEDNLGKVLEEQKIRRVKDMVGLRFG